MTAGELQTSFAGLYITNVRTYAMGSLWLVTAQIQGNHIRLVDLELEEGLVELCVLAALNLPQAHKTFA